MSSENSPAERQSAGTPREGNAVEPQQESETGRCPDTPCSASDDPFERQVQRSQVLLVIHDVKRDEKVSLEVWNGRLGLIGCPEFVDWLCEQIPEFRWPLTEKGLPLPAGNRRTVYRRVGDIQDHKMAPAPFRWVSEAESRDESGEFKLRPLRYVGFGLDVDLNETPSRV